jgi:hypothetical protein
VIHTVAVVRALNYRDRYQLGYASIMSSPIRPVGG